MSNHYALLIGIDHYFEYRLSNGTYYPKLGGCVRDIMQVYAFLTERIKVDPSHITKLTASLGGATPQEAENEWPTYTNMVNAFDELTAKLQPGDQLYIQYSGHGGRTTTIFPEIKGEGGFDEALVPLDIGKAGEPDARYLRDVEIHELLQRLVDKGVRLTVIFDCCHSGGATRTLGGARKRGIGQVDESPAPAESKVAPLDELIAHWPGRDDAASRGLQPQQAWHIETKGYTLFAACRANESAFEYPFNGRESNGALTYWMLDTLNNAGPEFSWQMVADRVTAKVHGQFAAQTPMLQGETDYKVFGHDRLSNHFAVAILEVNPTRGVVRLAAGEAHGLHEGTQFAVYPVGNSAEAQESNALATLSLSSLQDVEAEATVVSGDLGAIEVGAQAVMLNTTNVKLQRDIRVAIDDITLKSQVEMAIREQGKGFARLAGGAVDDYVLQVQEGLFVVADAAGEPLPNLRPALQVNDANALPQLVARLIHLIKYQNVLTLDMPDPAARATLQIDLEASAAVIPPGEKVKLTISNKQSPNPHDQNDPLRVLNVAVLILSSDWGIRQLYPENSAFEPVDPGKSIEIEFDAYLPAGWRKSHDIFKVFATRDTTDFRWLELPALDQPERQRALTRTAITDPLQALLATITDPIATTRMVKLSKASSSQKRWTTEMVALTVKA